MPNNTDYDSQEGAALDEAEQERDAALAECQQLRGEVASLKDAAKIQDDVVADLTIVVADLAARTERAEAEVLRVMTDLRITLDRERAVTKERDALMREKAAILTGIGADGADDETAALIVKLRAEVSASKDHELTMGRAERNALRFACDQLVKEADASDGERFVMMGPGFILNILRRCASTARHALAMGGTPPMVAPNTPRVTPGPAIDKVAWLPCRPRSDGKKAVLFARSKNQDSTFFTVGGKREVIDAPPGPAYGDGTRRAETDIECLVREVDEETGVLIKVETARLLHVFEGFSVDGVTPLTIRAYEAAYAGGVEPRNEIGELAWLTSEDGDKTSAMGREILRWLFAHGMID